MTVPFKINNKAVLAASALAALVCFPVLWKRHQAEHSHRAVEICIELNEARILCRSEGTNLSEFFVQASRAGVTSVALFERDSSFLDPADTLHETLRRFEKASRAQGDFSPHDIALVKAQGLHLVMRPSNGRPPHLGRLLEPFQKDSGRILLMPLGEETLGYPDSLEAMAELIRQGNFRLGMVEFAPQKGFEDLARKIPGRITRTHSIEAADLRKLGPERSRARLVRAVRERGIRALYLHLVPEKTLAENLDQIQSLAKDLERSGFVLGLAGGLQAPRGETSWRQAVGFLASISFPLAALWVARRSRFSPTARFFLLSGTTLSGGLLIGALGFCLPFMNGIELFRGVKLSLTLPLLVAPWILKTNREVRNLLSRPVLLRHAFVACFGVAALGVLIARSGNTGADLMPGFEGNLRDILQKVFLVRPRFKEFLIGHPLMFAGLNLSSSFSSKNSGWTLADWLIVIGMIGQTSMINTFSHFHIPIEISLLRTLLGLFIGYGLGQVLTRFLKSQA